jgi:uncharacterized Tic20 family protein
MAEQEDTGIAILSHVLAFFAGFIAPLIIYLMADEGSFAKENARNSLNWQITFLILALVSWMLVFVLIGLVLVPIVFLLDLIFIVIASVKASNGEAWEYPLTYDFV